jgi:hypothetical protein
MELSDQLDAVVTLPPANIPRYPTKRTLYGFQRQSGRFGDEKNRYQLLKEDATQ